MLRYYCDRCDKEIKEKQYAANPCIDKYEESIPQFGAIKFNRVQSDCKLCVDCMRKYISFLKGSDKDVK